MDRCGKSQVALRERGERSARRGRGDRRDGGRGTEEWKGGLKMQKSVKTVRVRGEEEGDDDLLRKNGRKGACKRCKETEMMRVGNGNIKQNVGKKKIAKDATIRKEKKWKKVTKCNA